MDSKNGNLVAFSIEGYTSWRTRLRKRLYAKHHRMPEILTVGPILIMETVTRTPTNPRDGDAIQERNIKKPEDYTPEEAKVSQLDGWAQDLIMSTVGQDHLSKIAACETAKEMWDILAKLSEGCDEIKENKLSHACQEFDAFIIKKDETIDRMEKRFMDIIAKIDLIRKGKYTVKEMNIKVLHALPEE